MLRRSIACPSRRPGQGSVQRRSPAHHTGRSEKGRSTGFRRGKRMKALCNREGLLAAFGMVSGVVPARSPKPILQNLKLNADPDEGSILMATDLEVGIR